MVYPLFHTAWILRVRTAKFLISELFYTVLSVTICYMVFFPGMQPDSVFVFDIIVALFFYNVVLA